MRSTIFAAGRVGAVLALVLAVGLVAAGCESTCGSCASPCSPAPCAAQPACQDTNCGPFPANAKAGEAWCCVWVPPVYKTETEQVCVCPEQCEQEWVPPTYETVTEQVICKPACSRTIPIPAEYSTVEECVEVCAARTEWQRVDCPPAEAACGKQDCYALVTIPPVYEKRCKQVCTKPESCRTEETPAEYTTVSKQVEKTCGYYKQNTIPAKYETREKQVCVTDGRWEWRQNSTCTVPAPAPTNPCTPAPATIPAPAPAAPEMPK